MGLGISPGFGINLGFSSKKSKSTLDQTQTPLAPPWYAPQVQGLAGQISGLAQTDPTQYVAPANDLLTHAGQGASTQFFDPTAYQSANGLFQGIMNSGAPQMKAASLLDGGLDKYLNPYTQDVVNSSLADYDFGAGKTQAQNQLALAGDTTFGGSGGAIQTAASNDAITRGRAALSSGLYDQGFNTATTLANQDADRVQAARAANAQLQAQQLALQAQAGRDIANNANAYYSTQQGIANNQANIGQILQQIQQAKAGAPIDVLTGLAGAFGSLTPSVGLLTGQRTTGTQTGNSSGWSLAGDWSFGGGKG